MSRALLLCALAFLTSPGDALRCIDCRDYSGRFCSGDAVTCPSDTDVCLSTLVQYEINSTYPQIQNILHSIGVVSPLTFVRGCGYSEGCTDVVVLRTPYSRSVTISRCCKSDLCTPETPTVLPEAPKNDLSCPGCFQITPDSCEGYITVQCRGNEVQCFSFNQLQLSDNITLAMAGCATKTACNLNLEDDKQKNLCTGGILSGAGGLYSSLLLLTAALLITSHIETSV